METHFSKISTGRNCSRNMVSSCKPLKKGLHFLLLASNFSNKLSEKKNYSHNNQRHTQKIMLDHDNDPHTNNRISIFYFNLVF